MKAKSGGSRKGHVELSCMRSILQLILPDVSFESFSAQPQKLCDHIKCCFGLVDHRNAIICSFSCF